MDIKEIFPDMDEELFMFQILQPNIEEVDRLYKLCPQARQLAFASFQLPNRGQYLPSAIPDEITKLTPIEQIFYIAYTLFLYDMSSIREQYRFCFNIKEQVRIEANEKVYTVDFLFNELFDKRLGFVSLKKWVVVELDGYEYHSSKEQRNHDTERENNLKMEGISVIRFTGSQITKNPFLCVMQAYKFIYEENKDYLEDLLRVNREKEKNGG